MCDVDKIGSLEMYETLPICDDDKFGSLEAYALRLMMISLEVWKFGGLQNCM